MGLSVALLLAAASPGDQPAGEADDFWGDLADPGRKAHLEALDRGKGIFRGAVKIQAPALKRRALEDALAAFQEAVGASPSKADGHFWVGVTLYEMEQMEEAIASFVRVRELEPAFDDQYSLSFKLGIAYSKLGQLEEAVEEYSRAAQALRQGGYRLDESRDARATLHGNAAESLMAMGRLDDAIQRYRQSLALQPGYILAWWGLAVALDRDEQVSKALEATARALDGDPEMKVLTSDGVFFVPAGDIHYYFALGHLAQGELAESKAAWEAFLKAVPDSPWAVRAQNHLAQLGASIEERAGRSRLAPTPRAAKRSETVRADQRTIRQAMGRYLTLLRKCYLKALSRRAGMTGTMRLSLTVSKRGRVQAVRVLASSLGSPALRSCVVSAIKRFSFPPLRSGAPVTVAFPLEFKP